MELKVPEVGESIFEAEVGKWHKKDGEAVKKDDLLCELETDKISLEMNAEADGVLHIKVQEGETVKIGTVIGELEETAEGAGEKKPATAKADAGKPKGTPAAETKDRPGKEEKKAEKPAAAAPEAQAAAPKGAGSEPQEKTGEKAAPPPPAASPVAPQPPAPTPAAPLADERITRQPMSPLRRRVAERLLAARQQTAMLTTFNEADLSRVMALRKKHGEEFEKKHGVKLGFMSFFVKAVTEALAEFPDVNARIDGEDTVYQHFYDIGVAIGGDKGLVVPVLRDADRMHFADIEQGIANLVDKVKTNKLAIADLEGGTFTISNGGVYGSLLSTPILNPPQSAVLGMHAIQQRPVAVDGEIVIRPMMYLALSYDHRIIDGRQAVTFLKRIKELVEEPEEMLLEL